MIRQSSARARPGPATEHIFARKRPWSALEGGRVFSRPGGAMSDNPTLSARE